MITIKVMAKRIERAPETRIDFTARATGKGSYHLNQMSTGNKAASNLLAGLSRYHRLGRVDAGKNRNRVRQGRIIPVLFFALRKLDIVVFLKIGLETIFALSNHNKQLIYRHTV